MKLIINIIGWKVFKKINSKLKMIWFLDQIKEIK